MARSLSNAKFLSAFVSDGISTAIFRRGFAAGTTEGAAVSRGGTAAVAAKKTGEQKERVESTYKVSWVPDPKTGYYRPETGAADIDPAELRAVLLANKKN